MKKLLVLITTVITLHAAQGQIQTPLKERSFFSFFRMKPMRSWESMRPAAPILTNVINGNLASFSYWQGGSYTSYSENGRFRSTHSFDVQGQLRESRASFSLRSKGALSYWRIQLSAQRSRPLFIYTIH